MKRASLAAALLNLAVTNGVPIEGPSATLRIIDIGCGAVLVAPTVALTAAHCPVTRVATLDGQAADVVNRAPHPDYAGGWGGATDLAVLQLSSALGPVSPLGVPALGTARLEGWSGGDLHSGSVYVDAIGPATLYTTPGPIDSCEGDSGGGLYQRGKLIGITTEGRGPHCGDGTGYVTVAANLGWVNEVLMGDWGLDPLPELDYTPPAPACSASPNGGLQMSYNVLFWCAIALIIRIRCARPRRAVKDKTAVPSFENRSIDT